LGVKDQSDRSRPKILLEKKDEMKEESVKGSDEEEEAENFGQNAFCLWSNFLLSKDLKEREREKEM